MRIPTLVLAVVATVTVGWSNMATAAADPQCDDFNGVVDSAQMCQITGTEPNYSLSISYPVDYPDVVPMIDYVKQTRDGFLNVANMPGTGDMPYELDMRATEFESAVPEPVPVPAPVPPRGTQSLVFETYQDVGGARPQTFFKTFNWDQRLRAPITIDNLFRVGTQPFPVIMSIVQNMLTMQSGQPVLLPLGVGLDPATYRNFAITNDTLIFYFSQGEVLPESAGAFQVAVPRAQIDSILA